MCLQSKANEPFRSYDECFFWAIFECDYWATPMNLNAFKIFQSQSLLLLQQMKFIINRIVPLSLWIRLILFHNPFSFAPIAAFSSRNPWIAISTSNIPAIARRPVQKLSCNEQCPHPICWFLPELPPFSLQNASPFARFHIPSTALPSLLSIFPAFVPRRPPFAPLPSFPAAECWFLPRQFPFLPSVGSLHPWSWRCALSRDMPKELCFLPLASNSERQAYAFPYQPLFCQTALALAHLWTSFSQFSRFSYLWLPAFLSLPPLFARPPFFSCIFPPPS